MSLSQSSEINLTDNGKKALNAKDLANQAQQTADNLNIYIKGSEGSKTLESILSMDPNHSTIGQVVNGQIVAAINTSSDGSVKIDGKNIELNGNTTVTGRLDLMQANKNSIKQDSHYYNPWYWDHAHIYFDNYLQLQGENCWVDYSDDTKLNSHSFYSLATLTPGYLKFTTYQRKFGDDDENFNGQISRAYIDSQRIEIPKVYADSVVSKFSTTVASRLSIKTDITPVTYDRALAAVEGTEMYDYRYVSDDSGQHYVSGIIDDVNPEPQYHMDGMLINKERTARIDANLVGYHHVVIQKLLERVATLETNNEQLLDRVATLEGKIK